MARSANAAMVKLALGIASVAALAGVTGRLAAADAQKPLGGGPDSKQEAQSPQEGPALQQPSDQNQGFAGQSDDDLFFHDDEGEDEGSEGQGFTLVPSQPRASSGFSVTPSQPSVRSRTRTRRS